MSQMAFGRCCCRAWICSDTLARWRYALAASTRARRACPLPAFVMPPRRRRLALVYSLGVRPRYFMSSGGRSKRVRSPSSATVMMATVNCTPRRACKASTTGYIRHVLACSRSAASKRPSNSVRSVTVRTYSWNTICWAGGGEDEPGQPPSMLIAPVGAPGIADVVAQQQRLETEAGVVEIPEGVFAGPREIADRLVGDLGHVDGGEIPGAGEASQGQGIALVGLDAVTRLARDQRGGDDEARQPFAGQVAVQPVATGPGLVDEHEPRPLALKLAHQGVDVALARADGAEVHRVPAIAARVPDYDGILVDVETDMQRAILLHS